ncbi:unnamed protein product, partial [Allacma fusca]
VFALFFFAAVVCVDPNIPLLFTSLFELPPWLFVIVFMVQFVLYTIHLISWYGMMLLYACPGMVYVFACRQILEEMTLGKGSYVTKDSLRTRAVLLETYRELQVLHTLADYTLFRYALVVSKCKVLNG